MTKKTHVAFACCVTAFMLRPTNIKYYIIDLTATSIGSLLPDIDVSTSESHKDIALIAFFSCLLIIAGLILDYYMGFGVIKYIQSNLHIAISILCFAFFLLFCAHGLHTPHRSFMHSIIASFIFTLLIYFIFKPAFIPFFIGYISHILLDIPNKKGVQILYPLDKRFCLKLCESDGIVNDIICIVSILLLIIK